MKRYVGTFALVLGVVLAATGCQGVHRNCNNCRTGGCGPTGCRPGHIGWQRGGTDYQKALSHQEYRNPQPGSGVTAAQTAYPYYTTRGPRDFFTNNPPTIGR